MTAGAELVARLSDLHLSADPTVDFFGENPAVTLRRVMDAFPSEPDVLLLTGDIAGDASEDA